MTPPTVLDIWGDAWAVREARGTPLGWDVLLGRPAADRSRGGPAVILTPALGAYLEAQRHTPREALVALPIGATALKRLRRLLGHHWRHDRAAWWLERLPDLADLTGAEFAARHGVSEGAASEWRALLLGPRLRPAGWWREPDTAEIIMTWATAPAADALDLAAVSVRRLRALLTAEAGQRASDHDA